MTRRIVMAFGVVLLTLTSLAAHAAIKIDANTLNNEVHSFVVRGQSRFAVLLEFSQTFRLPLGLEFVDTEGLKEPVDVSLTNANIRTALNVILPAEKGYRWSLQDGVIHVSSDIVPRGSKNLLDTVVSQFQFRQPVTVQWASENIKMALSHQLHPEAVGFAGHFPSGDTKNTLPPFSRQNATIRQLLNTIVSESGNGGAWVVRTSPDKLDRIPDRGLWKIFEYQTPPASAQSFLQHLFE